MEQVEQQLPTRLGERIADYEGTIRQSAKVDAVGAGRWRVTFADTDRVRCTVDYAKWESGGFEWLGSELWVDGTRRYLTDGPEDLADLLQDPDRHRLPPVELYDAATEDIPDTVPSIVRHNLSLLTRRLAGREDVSVVAEHDAWDKWRVRLTIGDDVLIVILFTASYRRKGRAAGWSFNKQLPFLVFADGAAGAIPGGMGALLALLAGKRPTPQGHPKVTHTAPAARHGSVEVRRASVIRV